MDVLIEDYCRESGVKKLKKDTEKVRLYHLCLYDMDDDREILTIPFFLDRSITRWC